MNYYPGEYDRVPAMDRMTYFLGGNCDAVGWNESLYGVDDYENRNVGLHTNASTVGQGLSRDTFDPGFRIRSLKIKYWGVSNCASAITYANRDFGRCLPSILLANSIYRHKEEEDGKCENPIDENDRDCDGLDDALENTLADTFRPIVLNHSTEQATRADVYVDFQGNSVIEPVVAFQVRKSSLDLDNIIEITYMQLWREDIGSLCDEHEGDSQSDTFYVKTLPSTDPLHGKFWWMLSTGGYSVPATQSTMTFNNDTEAEHLLPDPIITIEARDWDAIVAAQEAEERAELLATGQIYDGQDDSDLWRNKYENMLTAREKDADKIMLSHATGQEDGGSMVPMIDDDESFDGTQKKELRWQQGDTHIRAPRFDRMVNSPPQTNRHMLYYYSKGKHHAFIDGRYVGKFDENCTLWWLEVHANGRGELHDPPYPKRLLNLRSPHGKGDAYNYNNVGSRDHYGGFMNLLDDFGFEGKRVWQDACFYSTGAKAPNRGFMCANNINKLCCLEEQLNCSIPSGNWHCH